jgi:hypothetical protein
MFILWCGPIYVRESLNLQQMFSVHETLSVIFFAQKIIFNPKVDRLKDLTTNGRVCSQGISDTKSLLLLSNRIAYVCCRQENAIGSGFEVSDMIRLNKIIFSTGRFF